RVQERELLQEPHVTAGLSSALRVLRVVLGEQALLVVSLREEEEDDRGADQDRDDAGEVSPLVSVQEGLLRPGRDRRRVLGVLLGDRGGAGERFRELALDVVRDRRGGGADRGGRGGGVPGGQERPEDRL